MSCSPFDLKDYFFGELSAADRSATQSHLASCAACREELGRLGDTRAVLMSIPDEEPPRRIAFVSDKVFEPRWWQRLWTSGPQLGFASAAMLAAAILMHGAMMRPLTAPVAASGASAKVDTVAMQAEIDRRVEAKLTAVLAERDQQQMHRVMEAVNAKTTSLEQKRRNDLLLIGEAFERLNRSTQETRKIAFYGKE